MKQKLIYTLVIVLIISTFCGCADAKTDTSTDNQSNSESLNEIDADDENADGEDVDDIYVDLTQLSSTMIFAEINNMMIDPESYVGKKIRVAGLYYLYHEEDTDIKMHYIVIPDATECCQQGLEFVLSSEYNFPEDYPISDADIEIIGTFSRGEIEGSPFYYLESNDLVILSE